MSNNGRPVTVVAGGSRGIGVATVLALASAGHDLVMSYRSDSESAERVAKSATADGARCVALAADVTDPADVDRLFDEAGELGVLTGLVNNAGFTGHIGDLADTPVKLIRGVIDANLVGAVLCARRAIQAMSAQRSGAGGAIVNVSSAAATLGSAHEYVHYAAAKAGVDALTIGLAKEVAEEGIRVNAVAPGIVDTEIHADAGDPDRAKRAISRIPIGRVAEPSEIAAAIVWLLGPEAGYATGAVLRVAGGV